MTRSSVPGHRTAHYDDLELAIVSAFRSREGEQPDAAVVAAQLEDRFARLRTGADEHDSPAPVIGIPRRRTVAVAWALVAGLAVVGTAAAAHDPVSSARTLESVTSAAGLDRSFMPEGYTAEQYDAFWDAGYVDEDVEKLATLWNVDDVEAKARAGQLLLTGQPVPVSPSGRPGMYEPIEERAALADAGYTEADVETLSELWGLSASETEVRAGRLLRDGGVLPIPPSVDATWMPSTEQDVTAISFFYEYGYTYEDAEALAELWSVNDLEAKALAGQALLDGEALPIPPSGEAGADVDG